MLRTFTRLAALVPVIALVTMGLVSGVQAQSAKPRTPAPAPQTAAPSALVNLNTATLAELVALPGVGAKTAARIVDYRQKKGPFKKIEELMNVQGIGEKSFLKLKPQITVAANAAPAHAQ